MFDIEALRSISQVWPNNLLQMFENPFVDQPSQRVHIPFPDTQRNRWQDIVAADTRAGQVGYSLSPPRVLAATSSNDNQQIEKKSMSYERRKSLLIV
jgi:hypothetical protein